MASAVAQGSDSHDAPLLFVLPCESSVRLCLPPSFLSARCLRGKVSLPFPLPYFRALSLFHSLFRTRWAQRSVSFRSSGCVCRRLSRSFLIRNETHFTRSFFPLPLCPRCQTTPHYCPCFCDAHPPSSYLVTPPLSPSTLICKLTSLHITRRPTYIWSFQRSLLCPFVSDSFIFSFPLLTSTSHRCFTPCVALRSFTRH